MNVALLHHWLVTYRGGEQVLEAIGELVPDADIYTHVVRTSELTPGLRRHEVRTTFIQRLPFSSRLYPYYLPLMPLALDRLDMSGYDLVISSEAGPSKGVLCPPGSFHVCYCHSPMRYLWDHYHVYCESLNPLARPIFRLVAHYMRAWDRQSALGVDQFVANSRFVAQRIWRVYRRDAEVIHPPVDVDFFAPKTEHQGYYLVLGQLVPYKRADLVVDAFRDLDRKAVVVGEGPELARLRKGAPPNVEFRGRLTRSGVRQALENCRALLFPGEEDFGIVPLEAMASGKPVIAYGSGGVLDTVRGDTGVLFNTQSTDSLRRAIQEFEERESDFQAADIALHASSFSKQRFQEQLRDLLALHGFPTSLPPVTSPPAQPESTTLGPTPN